MKKMLRKKIITISNEKIAKKRNSAGLSFYAFFENKNTDPKALFEVATWWIKIEQLDHFEKVQKIQKLIKNINK